jgi:hypothetical protein
MYKRYNVSEVPFCNPEQSLPGTDLAEVVGKAFDIVKALGLTNIFQPLINCFRNGTIDGQIKVCDHPVVLRRGKMFSPTTTREGTISAELGISHFDAPKVIEMLKKINAKIPFPGAFGLRFVNKTTSRLGFTKFPTTCTVDLAGVNMTEMHQFYNSAWEEIKKSGIPFTQHWGKVNNYDAGNVQKAFGNDVDAWKKHRSDILGDYCSVFENELIRRCGLDYKTISNPSDIT